MLTFECDQDLTAINSTLGRHCYNLKILYLHENRIAELKNLHRLEELNYLNVALNLIDEIKGLEKCRSLTKLDLTANRISLSKLHSVARLEANESLEDLFLLGNPCTKARFYRAFVISVLPRLKRLDGKRITHEERSAALGQKNDLRQKVSDTADPVVASDEKSGIKELPTFRNPCGKNAFCPDPVDAGAHFFQTNQGRWNFKLSESEDKSITYLEIPIGKMADSNAILVDIQPGHLECSIEGKLLRLKLFEDVLPSLSKATRSVATGSLLLSMPKAGNHNTPSSTPVGYA